MFDNAIADILFSWDALLIAGLALYLLSKIRRTPWVSVPSSAIQVVDGDTFTVLLTSGDRVAIRPRGFDAPEINQKGGRMAVAYLRKLAKQGFYVREIEADIYGRTIADVRIGENGKGGNLAAHMLSIGLAHSVAESGFGRFVDTLTPRLLGRGIWQNSWLGYTLTHPAIHRGAKQWNARCRSH